MPDTMNDSTKDVFIDRVRYPVTDFNYFPQMRLSIPMPPVIGRAPEKRSHRWWKLLFRVGTRVHDRIARLAKEECFGSYYRGEFYWVRNEWPWLETVEKKCEASRSKPIYDPNLKPKPVEWGWSKIGPELDPSISLDLERNVLVGDYTRESTSVSDDPAGANPVPGQG